MLQNDAKKGREQTCNAARRSLSFAPSFAERQACARATDALQAQQLLKAPLLIVIVLQHLHRHTLECIMRETCG